MVDKLVDEVVTMVTVMAVAAELGTQEVTGYIPAMLEVAEDGVLTEVLPQGLVVQEVKQLILTVSLYMDFR